MFYLLHGASPFSLKNIPRKKKAEGIENQRLTRGLFSEHDADSSEIREISDP